MNFKKIIAIALSFGVLLIFSPTYAMISPDGISYSTEATKSTDELIYEFESIAPGVFFVDPNFKNTSKTDPDVAHKILSQAVNIFKMFPNITHKLVEMAQLTEEKKFKIKIIDIENSEICRKLHTMGLETKGYAPLGHCFPKKNALELHICGKQSEYDRTFSKSAYNYFAPVTTDRVTYNVTHEIGHVIAFVSRHIKDKDKFSDSIDFYAASHELIMALEDEDKLLEALLKLNGHADTGGWIAEADREELKRITTLTQQRGGSRLCSIYPSLYARVNDDECIAELIAYALCNGKSDKLGIATIDWLKEKDAQCMIK